MKKLLLSLFLCCLVTSTLVSSVSAQLPYFTVKFDALYYYLGQTGAVQVEIETADQAFDIRDMGLQLYFTRTDGTRFVTELFLVNYTDTPLQLSKNDNANVTIDFVIPTRSDLVSGVFQFIFYVNLREQGTTTYSEESPGEQYAKINDDYYCILISSETTPSPTPTTSPTPTPTPTATPTSTPTPTATPTSTPTPTATPPPVDYSLITILFVIGIIIIAVLLIIILIMLKKGKE